MNDAELRSLERLCSKDDLSDSNVATVAALGLKAASEVRRLRARLDASPADDTHRRFLVSAALAELGRQLTVAGAIATATVRGMRQALTVVERRRVHYERYRCQCSKLGGEHHNDCAARWMETNPATFAVLDETIAMIESAISRVTNGSAP